MQGDNFCQPDDSWWEELLTWLIAPSLHMSQAVDVQFFGLTQTGYGSNVMFCDMENVQINIMLRKKILDTRATTSHDWLSCRQILQQVAR